MVGRVSRRNYRSKRVKSGRSRSLRKRVRSRALRKLRRRRSRRMRGGALPQVVGSSCDGHHSISTDGNLICRNGVWHGKQTIKKNRTGKPQPQPPSAQTTVPLPANLENILGPKLATYGEKGVGADWTDTAIHHIDRYDAENLFIYLDKGRDNVPYFLLRDGIRKSGEAYQAITIKENDEIEHFKSDPKPTFVPGSWMHKNIRDAFDMGIQILPGVTAPQSNIDEELEL
jgi:hypothetical protein